MIKELKDKLAQLLEGWGRFRTVLTLFSLASLVWGVWFGTFPMPHPLYKIARLMGVLSSVFGVLFSLAWRPNRPLAVSVKLFLTGWGLFGANYMVANTMEGMPRLLALIVDLCQIGMFAGFFLCFAMSLGVCIRIILPRPVLPAGVTPDRSTPANERESIKGSPTKGRFREENTSPKELDRRP